MLFMLTYSVRPEHWETAVKRFKETQGAPPSGVKQVGRWHDVSLKRGFILAESNDLEAVGKWCQQWSDLTTFEIVPVIDDDQFNRVLA